MDLGLRDASCPTLMPLPTLAGSSELSPVRSTDSARRRVHRPALPASVLADGLEPATPATAEHHVATEP